MKLSEIREAARTVAGVTMWNEATDDEYDALEIARAALPALLEAVERYFHGDEDFDEALLHAGIEVDE